MTKRSTWALPYAIFLILFVALPLILIMVYAFQDGSGNWTLGNFTKFFRDTDAINTFALSLEVAIENTAICILLGYPAAWILANKKLNKSAVTIVLFIMPMWINALMRTLATAELFHMLGVQLGKGTARWSRRSCSASCLQESMLQDIRAGCRWLYFRWPLQATMQRC